MQTKPFPAIEASDLKAAREFLNALTDDGRESRPTRPHSTARGPVTVHQGITRARLRSALKNSA